MPREENTRSAVREIVALLEEDQDAVLALFEQYRARRDTLAADARESLVESACTELVIHSQIEQECLYPALLELLVKTGPVEEAEVEHAVMRRLIGEMEAMQPGDARYDACFTVLGEYVTLHVARERVHIFPAMVDSGADFKIAAQDIRHRRRELRSEFGMPDEAFDEEPPHGEGPVGSGSAGSEYEPGPTRH